MYDFLLVAPHGNASHSLIQYLNQHPRLHVGPYFGVAKASHYTVFENAYRPWMKTLGIASKHYHVPAVVDTVLGNVKRDVFIQTVRDPIEAFISVYRNEELAQTFFRLRGYPSKPVVAEDIIADAVQKYITPGAAEAAFQADTFKSHIIIDVLDMKGDLSEGVVKRLWRLFDGDDNVPGAVYKPLGSAPFHILRTVSNFSFKFSNLKVDGSFHYDGDLLLGAFDLNKGVHSAHETCVATYPDALQFLPALGVAGPLHVRVSPAEYFLIPPGVREKVVAHYKPELDQTLHDINAAYAEAKEAMRFSIDQLTADQRAMLKAGVEPDYIKFAARHPEIAARWTVTREFLGIRQ